MKILRTVGFLLMTILAPSNDVRFVDEEEREIRGRIISVRNYYRNDQLILRLQTITKNDAIFSSSMVFKNSEGKLSYSLNRFADGRMCFRECLGREPKVTSLIDFENDGQPDLLIVDAGKITAEFFVFKDNFHAEPIRAELYVNAIEKGGDWLIETIRQERLADDENDEKGKINEN